MRHDGTHDGEGSALLTEALKDLAVALDAQLRDCQASRAELIEQLERERARTSAAVARVRALHRALLGRSVAGEPGRYAA